MKLIARWGKIGVSHNAFDKILCALFKSFALKELAGFPRDLSIFDRKGEIV